MTTHIQRLVPALAALVLLSACAPAEPEQKTEQQSGGDERILALGREYSQCVRTHGVPGYPDLVVDNGTLALPDDGNAEANRQALRDKPDAMAACQPILDRLPAGAQKNPPLTDADRQNLLAYARCMRENGVPEWPDPAANGTFPILGTPLETEGKSERIVTAQRACRQYWDRPIAVK